MIKDNITNLIMQATKEKDTFKMAAYKDVKNAIMSWQTNKENVKNKLEYNDEVELGIIKKLVKTYNDTAEQCNDGNHEELVKNAKDTAAFLANEFLPKPATEEDIIKAFDQVHNTTGMDLIKKNMGSFIKEIKKLLPGADGKLMAKVVSSKLS